MYMISMAMCTDNTVPQWIYGVYTALMYIVFVHMQKHLGMRVKSNDAQVS